jgi:hypothetical protein
LIVHYRKDGDKFYIQETDLIDEQSAMATFADREQNTSMVGTGTYVYIQSTGMDVWDIPHDMGLKGVLMSVYGNDNIRIHPDQYELVDSDNCQIRFDHPTSGYCVLVSVGDLSLEDLLEELEDRISSVTWVAYDHDDIGDKFQVDSGSYVRVYKDDDFYYFDFELDKESTYIVKEIELFDKYGDLLFQSLMSDLYKPPGVDLVLHYRLSIPGIN